MQIRKLCLVLGFIDFSSLLFLLRLYFPRAGGLFALDANKSTFSAGLSNSVLGSNSFSTLEWNTLAALEEPLLSTDLYNTLVTPIYTTIGMIKCDLEKGQNVGTNTSKELKRIPDLDSTEEKLDAFIVTEIVEEEAYTLYLWIWP